MLGGKMILRVNSCPNFRRSTKLDEDSEEDCSDSTSSPSCLLSLEVSSDEELEGGQEQKQRKEKKTVHHSENLPIAVLQVQKALQDSSLSSNLFRQRTFSSNNLEALALSNKPIPAALVQSINKLHAASIKKHGKQMAIALGNLLADPEPRTVHTPLRIQVDCSVWSW